MKNIIFIAPPAAGKGTQASLVSKYYNIPHISIGDIMRDARDESTQIGRIIIKCQDERSLVPLDITLQLLKKRILDNDCKSGYILDGFPRSLEQALEYDKILDSLGIDVGIVIFLDIDRDLALERTLGRVVCPKCKEVYNLNNVDLRPKVDYVCDKCGSELKTRSDDNEETFIKGFDTYMEETMPLIDYYDNLGVLKKIVVDRNKSAEDIFSEIKEIIG